MSKKTQLLASIGVMVVVVFATGVIVNTRPSEQSAASLNANVQTQTNAQPAQTMNSVSEKVFLMGGFTGSGQANDVWSSNNASSWTPVVANAGWSPRVYFVAAYLNNKLWVIGGNNSTPTSQSYLNDVWSSVNGSTWVQSTNAPWLGREIFAYTVFNNKIWIFGGHYSYSLPNYPYMSNEVWSFDGTTWVHIDTDSIATGIQDAPWPTTEVMTSAATYNGKMYVMTSAENPYHNDIWSSPNGINWTHVDTDLTLPGIQDAQWSPRAFSAITSFNNSLYLTGGLTYPVTPNNETWISNGTSWTQSSSNGPWASRTWHKIFSINNKLYLAGGSNLSQSYNDVWVFQPASNAWTQVIPSASWSQRYGHQVVVTPATFGQCQLTFLPLTLPTNQLQLGIFQTISKIQIRGCAYDTKITQEIYRAILSTTPRIRIASLYVDGVQVSSQVPSSNTITFANSITIPANSTKIFEVKALMAGVGPNNGALVPGDYIRTQLFNLTATVPSLGNQPPTFNPTLPLPTQSLMY